MEGVFGNQSRSVIFISWYRVFRFPTSRGKRLDAVIHIFLRHQQPCNPRAPFHLSLPLPPLRTHRLLHRLITIRIVDLPRLLHLRSTIPDLRLLLHPLTLLPNQDPALARPLLWSRCLIPRLASHTPVILLIPHHRRAPTVRPPMPITIGVILIPTSGADMVTHWRRLVRPALVFPHPSIDAAAGSANNQDDPQNHSASRCMRRAPVYPPQHNMVSTTLAELSSSYLLGLHDR